MTDKITKYASLVLYLLMAVSAVLSVLFYMGTIESDTLLRWGYILIIAGVIIALASPIIGFISNPKGVVKLLLTLGLAALIAIVSYSFSGNTFSDVKLQTLNITAETSRWVGMGMLFTYILAVISLLTILYSSVIKIFK
ncbi:MAG TPA: hypothetical protein PKE03_02775 [Bacteroidales bacterium]|mgnify:CR=1 FL=1|nr:hypothetical protein [Bacteroidales bacterium]